MRKEFMYKIPSRRREGGYEQAFHVQDAQSPLEERV